MKTMKAMRRWGTILRRIVGMPDYRAHVAHLRECHPDRPIPTEREFFDEYVTARYGTGGQRATIRCC